MSSGNKWMEIPISDDIKEGDRIGISLTHQNIDHPVYGKAESLTCIVPLLIPFGTYKPPPILSDEPRFQRLVKEFTVQYRDLWEDEMDEEVEARIRDYISMPIYMDPFNEIESNEMRGSMIHSILAIAVDDIVDNLGDTSELGIDFSYATIDKALNALNDFSYENYKDWAEIPVPLPAFKAPIRHIWEMDKTLHATIPNFNAKKKSLKVVSNLAANSFANIHEKIAGEEFSETSLKIFGSYVNGGQVGLEFLCLLRDVLLTPEQRQELLVQIISNNLCLALSSLNSIIGLLKDMKGDEVSATRILRLKVNKGLTLEDAFKRVAEELYDEVNDIGVAAKKLRRRFPDDKVLEDWLQIVEYCLDGQLYWYTNLKRYGQIGVKLVKL